MRTYTDSQIRATLAAIREAGVSADYEPARGVFVVGGCGWPGAGFRTTDAEAALARALAIREAK